MRKSRWIRSDRRGRRGASMMHPTHKNATIVKRRTVVDAAN